MSLSGDRLARAEQRSARARARLLASASTLKSRLTPRRLVQDAVHEARRTSEALAETGAETAKRHPVALVGLLAGLIGFMIRRKMRAHPSADETEPDAQRLKPERATSRRTRKSR